MSRSILAALVAVVFQIYALCATAQDDRAPERSAWLGPRDAAVTIREPLYPAPREPFRVLGFTEREALEASADPYGNVWSSKHLQGDLANRWTHAAIVKGASAAFSEAGFGTLASALLGAAILLPKEFMFDKRPSASDLVIADFPLFASPKGRPEETRASLSFFGDGAFFLALQKKF